MRTNRAIGWIAPRSIAVATASASVSQLGMQQGSCSPCPLSGSIALQINSPVVNVPVLSNATVSQTANASSTSPPFKRMPCTKNLKKFPTYESSLLLRTRWLKVDDDHDQTIPVVNKEQSSFQLCNLNISIICSHMRETFLSMPS